MELPLCCALAHALLKQILSLWDSSLVDANSRATPEPTQLLENPKRYPLYEDTFFLTETRQFNRFNPGASRHHQQLTGNSLSPRRRSGEGQGGVRERGSQKSATRRWNESPPQALSPLVPRGEREDKSSDRVAVFKKYNPNASDKLLYCRASVYRFPPIWTQSLRHEQKSSRL